MEQIFRDAGFPDGAYVNIYATNEQIERVIADPRVRGVSVTGSERAGAAVAEIAGRNLKKVVLELGGSDPFIVLCTDDLDEVGRDRRRGAHRQRRAVVQRREAVHRDRRALRAVPREVHGRAHRREARAIRTSARPSSGRSRLSVAADRLEDQVRARGRAGRDARRRGQAQRQLLHADRADGRHTGERRLPRGALRPGRAGLPRAGRRTRRSSSPTTRRSASART